MKEDSSTSGMCINVNVRVRNSAVGAGVEGDGVGTGAKVGRGERLGERVGSMKPYFKSQFSHSSWNHPLVDRIRGSGSSDDMGREGKSWRLVSGTVDRKKES